MNNKNNNCINSFFGTRIFSRGSTYFINIQKYKNYLLAFKLLDNNNIIFMASATTNYTNVDAKINLCDSTFVEVNSELDSFKNLINCFNNLKLFYVNSYQNKSDGILELFLTNDNIIYYIPNIKKLDISKENWLLKNVIPIENQWFWYKKKPNMSKSIWEFK